MVQNSRKKEHKQVSFFLIGFFILIIVGFAVLLYLDWKNLKEAIYQANLLLVIPAIIFSLFSYAATSYAFVLICRLFNIQTNGTDLFKLGFVTIAIGNLLDLGGVGGYALRISYLKTKEVGGREVLALSLLHSYLGFVSLLTLLVGGLSYLFITHKISIKQDPALFYGLGVALTVISVGTLFLLIPRLRRGALKIVAELIKFFTSKNIDEKIDGFHAGLSQGLHMLKEKKRNTLVLGLLFIVSWLLAAISLFFCFLAFAQKVKFGALIAGFSVGIFTGMFSFIPGGVGAQDGSMSGIFALIGIPFTTALLAALLFRLVFNIFPNIISIFLYGQMVNAEVNK
jgi:uncharacterized protein (TIRG00374 family)